MSALEVARSILVDPLAYSFMRSGLTAVLLLGVASGLVGVFVVQRQLTFFGHALSYAVFPALVVATALRVDLVLGGAIGAVLTVVLVLGLRRRADVGEDSGVGIVFIGLLALGAVLAGLLKVRSQAVSAALVGNVLGVGTGDLIASAALVMVAGLVIAALYRPLVLVSFDRSSALAIGLPVAWLDLVLLALVAATATLSVQVVGVILTVAVLVAPAATARMWVGRVPSIMLLSAAIAVAAGALGLYVTYFVPIAPGSVIVLVLATAFGASILTRAATSARRR